MLMSHLHTTPGNILHIHPFYHTLFLWKGNALEYYFSTPLIIHRRHSECNNQHQLTSTAKDKTLLKIIRALLNTSMLLG